MSDLISRARALRNLAGQATTAADLTLVDGLISAATRALEAYCSRSFGLVNRDELVDGRPYPTLWLRHYPIACVERIASHPAAVLRAQNSAVSQAHVQVVDDGVQLLRVVSGSTAVDRISFLSAPTLSALAAAIAFVGHGWSVSVSPGVDGTRLSADLAVFPGSFAASRAPEELRMHVGDMSRFEIDARLGAVRRLDRADWCGGPAAWRVVYTAGYDAIPEDVQEACAQIVAQLFYRAKRDPGLARDEVSGTYYRLPIEGVAPMVLELLAPYRRFLREEPCCRSPRTRRTTCIARRQPPPAAPTVAGLAGYLASAMPRALAVARRVDAWQRFTHRLLVGLDVDVRDPFDGGNPASDGTGQRLHPRSDGSSLSRRLRRTPDARDGVRSPVRLPEPAQHMRPTDVAVHAAQRDVRRAPHRVPAECGPGRGSSIPRMRRGRPAWRGFATRTCSWPIRQPTCATASTVSGRRAPPTRSPCRTRRGRRGTSSSSIGRRWDRRPMSFASSCAGGCRRIRRRNCDRLRSPS